MLHQEIVLFRLCVHTRGLVAWNWTLIFLGPSFPFSLWSQVVLGFFLFDLRWAWGAFHFPCWGREGSLSPPHPPPNLLSIFLVGLIGIWYIYIIYIYIIVYFISSEQQVLL